MPQGSSAVRPTNGFYLLPLRHGELLNSVCYAKRGKTLKMVSETSQN